MSGNSERSVTVTAHRKTAVSYVVRNSSLDGHPFLGGSGAYNGDGALSLMWDNNKPWSTGERVLLNLILSIANVRDDFAVADLDDLDAATRQFACYAIGIAAGVWADYEGEPLPWRMEGRS